MFSKLLVVMAVTVVAVNAQGGILGNASSCAIQCIVDSATAAGCTLPTAVPTGPLDPDVVKCLCADARFNADAETCLRQCPPTDLAVVESLQKQFCVSASTTLAPTANATTTDLFTISSIPSGSSNATLTGTSTGGSSKATATGSGASSGSGSGASSASGSSSAAETSASGSAAISLTNNNVVAAFLALITGFLVI